MVDAFATYTDLELRLGRTFTVGEQPQITSLLEDASTYLRDIIGLQLYPQATSTFTAYPDGGRVDLPQNPVISLGVVVREGVTLVEGTDFTRRDNSLYFHLDDKVDITFTYGYTSPPDGLLRWACVLASNVLLTLEQNLGLTAGGLSSVAIDDFKAAWADGGESSGMNMSERNMQLLRDQYGAKSTYVVGMR
jgi:hypothetical protein